MGVAREYRGNDVGYWILDFVVGMARSLSDTVGLRYVTLDALKQDKLVAWYARYGFVGNAGHSKSLAKILNLGHRDDLMHVSMRYDVLLKAEVVTAT
jgi:GNAT superfamily N-acetyltransferase